MGPHETAMMKQLVGKLENDSRNELHSVMGMLELIAEGPLTELQYDYLRTCRSSADRVLRTVQSVSEFLTPDNENAHVCNFDLQEAVANVTSVMESLAQHKGLRFTCDTRLSTPRWVAGDRDRIQDVLFRLLENAIRFTNQGQVELIVTEAPEEASGGIDIQFDVCDTGPGISADLIAGIVRPSPENPPWRGLGLPIARKLVQAMGGELSIGYREGGGCSVSFSLLLKAAPAAPRESEPNRVDRGSQVAAPLHILVAEDSDDSFYVLESYLGEHHYHFTRAVDGRAAIELFKRGHFDLVLMDVHMPGMDGYSATRAIREWETAAANRTRVPIVILSSDPSRTQRRHGAKAGCSGYLSKPVSKVDLLQVLTRYAGTSTEYWLP